MKKGIFAAAALAAFFSVPAGFAGEAVPAPENAGAVSENRAKPDAAQTRISRVVVFPRGARVTRSAKIRLRAGEQEILLAGVPANLRAESLTAETRIAGARISAVSSEIQFFAPATDAAAISEAKEKLDRARCARTDLTYRHAEASARLRALNEFRPSAGARENAAPFPSAFNAETALRTLAFLEKSASETIREVIRLKKELDAAALDLEVAESEYGKVASYAKKSERVVRVKIFAEKDAEGEIDVNYMTNDAQWRPSYDLRVDPATKSATLVSYGVVSQRTGEDWVGVPVTLSTAHPDVSANLPEFRKILVTERFVPAAEHPVAAASSYSASAPARAGAPKKAARQNADARLVLSNAGTNGIVFEDGGSASGVLDVQYRSGNYIFRNSEGVLQKVPASNVRSISQSSVETAREDIPAARLRDPSDDLRGLDFRYDLARAETIRSTGTPQRHLLASKTFAGDFYYQLAPSENSHAYQMLDVTNGNFRPILAGPANIFFGSDFIGDMDVPYTVRAGTVRIPLGVDPRVSVERRKINAIETVGTFTSSRRNSVSVSIKIRNRTPEPIRAVCAEAVPVSTEKAIEVSEPKFSPAAANFEKETGLAQWRETLAPAAEVELRAEYAVEYPTGFALEEHSH